MAEPEGAVTSPPPAAASGDLQGAVGGEGAGAPPPGSGRAVYRGAGKGPKPGNGAGGSVPKVPVDELAQLAIVPEEERRYQRRSFFDDGVYKPSHVTEKSGKFWNWVINTALYSFGRKYNWELHECLFCKIYDCVFVFMSVLFWSSFWFPGLFQMQLSSILQNVL